MGGGISRPKPTKQQVIIGLKSNDINRISASNVSNTIDDARQAPSISAYMGTNQSIVVLDPFNPNHSIDDEINQKIVADDDRMDRERILDVLNANNHDIDDKNSNNSKYSGDNHDYDHDHDRLDEKNSEMDDMEEEFAEKSAEMFQNTAMSLGMDNEELLFNLMYFGGNNQGSFDHMVNSALEETVALHSDNNTPYKLKPASDTELAYLNPKILDIELPIHDNECAVCRDVIVIGDSYIELELCTHHFHSECLLRWLKLQAWCPTCRHPITHELENKNTTTNKKSFIDSFETINEKQQEEGDEEDDNDNEEVNKKHGHHHHSCHDCYDINQNSRVYGNSDIYKSIASQTTYKVIDKAIRNLS